MEYLDKIALATLGGLGLLGIFKGKKECPREEDFVMGAGKDGTYRTALEDVFIGSWLKFSTLPGKEIALWPMTKNAADKKAGVVLARMDLDGQLALAKKLGGRVPFLSELNAAIRAREVAIVQMSNQPVETMGKREASIKHDKEARAKFAAMGLLFPDDHINKDGADYYSDAPVFFTKTWCVLDDDPNFKATIKPPMGGAKFPSVDYSGKDWGMGHRAPEWGFWDKSKKPVSQDGPEYNPATLVQGNSTTGYGAHNFGHVDYSMVPCVIRNVGG